MKFNCKKNDFQNMLNFAQNIVNNKSTISILSNVLIESEGNDTIYITATDLEIGFKCKITAEILEPGCVTLPAKKLFDVIKGFPVTDINMEISDRNVATLQSPNSIAKIVGLPKDEFPNFPEIKQEKIIKINQYTLKKMLQKTAYAISNDTTRYVLTGLYMSFEKGLSFVATDGKRLAVIKKNTEIPEDFKNNVIVPEKTINELIRILDKDEDVIITILGNQIAFILSDIVVVSRLIEGHFPDYKQVIPEKTEEKIKLNKDEFMAAISRASNFTDKKSNSIKFAFTENKVTVSANITEIGESKDEIDIAYTGKEISIAFNPDYMIDVLKVIESDDIVLELIDSESPGVIKEDEFFTYVIMPMRIS